MWKSFLSICDDHALQGVFNVFLGAMLVSTLSSYHLLAAVSHYTFCEQLGHFTLEQSCIAC